MIGIAEPRPPYVTFEIRAIEDRERSLQEGRYVPKDVVYAIITPQGSKDRLERIAEEWFEQLTQQEREGRFPAEWLRAFRGAFAEWKEGREPAVNGTDVRNWPAVSPAQVKALLDAKLRTVEDLAVANEESIARIGMGGRALKAKAIEWLASARDIGKQAEQLAALKTENADLKAANERVNEQLQEVLKRLAALEPPAPKDPRKL